MIEHSIKSQQEAITSALASLEANGIGLHEILWEIYVTIIKLTELPYQDALYEPLFEAHQIAKETEELVAEMSPAPENFPVVKYWSSLN